MRSVTWGILAVCACASGGLAHADTYVYSDDTTGGPTWNRPVEALTSLSTVGTDVPFHALDFWVDVSGGYDLENTAGSNLDGMLFLYHLGFNPKDPLHKAVDGDDDSGPDFRPGIFGFSLTAGEQYTLVFTGFQNTDEGTFTNRISGPGGIYAETLPEPGTLALTLAGLAGLAMLRRRRREAPPTR